MLQYFIFPPLHFFHLCCFLRLRYFLPSRSLSCCERNKLFLQLFKLLLKIIVLVVFSFPTAQAPNNRRLSYPSFSIRTKR